MRNDDSMYIRLSDDDREHLQTMADELNQGLREWSASRRRVWRTVALVVAVVLPIGWYMLLPQRVDDRRVMCNIPGDEGLVLNRACTALGNCDSRSVAGMLK